MTAAMILYLALAHAPAPKDRPPPPPPAVKAGTYVMRWHGIDAMTIFHADGFYACLWCGCWWHGSWACEKGRLRVEEWPLSNPASRCRWEVILKGPRDGAFPAPGGGTPWKLTPTVSGRES